MKICTIFLLVSFTFSGNAQWTSFELSVPRSNTSAVVIGDKLVFASGNASGEQYENAKKRIDIYDVFEDSWTTTDLSIIRQYTFAEAINNKLYVAGYTQSFKPDQNEIEIFDLETEEWSSMEFPTIYGATSLTSMGDLLVGVHREKVDIFNTVTEEWSSHELSENRILAQAQGCNGKLYFAGGGSYVQGTFNTIDIYDVAENIWTTDTLTDYKNEIKSICINDHVYFVGGGIDFSEVSSVIEKINTADGSKEIIEIEDLDIRNGLAATEQYLYIGIEKLENNDYTLIRRMDLISYELDSIYIPNPRTSVGMVAHDHKVYFAGGLFPTLDRSSIVDVFSELPSSIKKKALYSRMTVFPNPSHSELNIVGINGKESYEIFNLLGQKTKEGVTNGNIPINHFQKGTYYLKLGSAVLTFVKL